MSWSLSLDRAPRPRKPTSYSDVSRYKEASTEDDNPSKKKRGRPPRSGSQNANDSAPQHKKRGRPPKFPRPQAPINNNYQKNDDQFKQPKYKLTKKYESSSSSQSKSSSTSSGSDLDEEKEYYSVDYAYEYDYDYESDVPKNEEVIQTNPIQNSIKPPPPVKNSVNQIRAPKKNSKTKFPLQRNDLDYLYVQGIIGQSDNFLAPQTEPISYFVKFKNMPYNYCQWLTISHITKYDGGELALKKYMQKLETNELVHSLSIPHLMTFSNSDIITQWFEVDRIFGETVINVSPSESGDDTASNDDAKTVTKYLIKWRELDYDSSYYESIDRFKDTQSITQYKKRMLRMNPKKIPSRWVHPNASQLIRVTQRPISKNGEVFRDFQMDGLNWLIECWFQRRHSIFGDLSREGKMAELIGMLNFLSSQFQINGPFLILASDKEIPSWKEQLENWSSLNVVVLDGSTPSRQITQEKEMEVRDERSRLNPDYVRFDVLLTSYELFLITIPNFNEIEWRYVIADDGYKMKNSKGRIRNTLRQLKYEHITLSMEWEMLKPKNDVGIYQIFFLMNFVNPVLFANFNDFVKPFIPFAEEKVAKLIQLVGPFFFSRDEETIKNQMKQKEETVVIVQPSPLQKRLYVEAVKKKTEILMKPITDQADAPLAQLISLLRELVDHPLLAFPPPEESDPREVLAGITQSSGKMHFVDLLLKELVPQGKRIMIFSQYVGVLSLLEFYLKGVGIDFERIDSMTTADDRLSIIAQYVKKGTSVFLFSSKPGSYQIDLNLFDVVIVYDKDSYSFASEMKGTLYRLVTNGSFEMTRMEKSEPLTCFDEQPIQYMTYNKYRVMDAEDIELMLRDSITPMFSKSDEEITAFFSMGLREILAGCKKEDAVEVSTIDYHKQKKFWNEMLKPPQQAKKGNSQPQPDQAKQLISSLIDHGFQGGRDQLDLLKCALTLAPPEDEVMLQYLNEIVGDNSSDKPVHRFGAAAPLIDTRASKLFENVVFFARLKRALFFCTNEDLVWPSSSDPESVWIDFTPLDEYSLMYAIDQHGTKQLASMVEKAKELRIKQIEKRIIVIIDSIEKQYSVSGGFPQIPRHQYKKSKNETENTDESESESMENDEVDDENKFVPLSPKEWSELHPGLVLREIIDEDEMQRIFETICNFGIQMTGANLPDLRRFASAAGISHVSLDAIEACIVDILKISLSFLNSKELSVADLKYGKALSEKFDRDQFLTAFLACRLMEKVYAFLNEKEIEHEESETDKVENKYSNLKIIFEKVGVSEKLALNYSSEQIAQFFESLAEFGVNETERWSSEGKLSEFPPDAKSRLALASKIIDLVDASNVVKASVNLNVFNFGKFVDSDAFAGKKVPYPIGFVATHFVKKRSEEMSKLEKWYRCEIQSAAFFPLFVVSVAEQPDTEFVAADPNEAWELAFQSIIGASETDELLKKVQLDGEWLFGLTHPDIISTVSDMEKK